MGGKVKIAARITIVRPGKMSLAGRREVARWMRKMATNFLRLGGLYVSTGNFSAAFHYTDKGARK